MRCTAFYRWYLPVWLLQVWFTVVYSGQVNVALNKKYSQSTFSSFDDRRPENAANDNTDGTFSDNNCIRTSSSDDNPWWQVDLGQVYPVLNLTIYGRANFESNLEPSTITVDGRECVRITSMPSRAINISCSSTLYGRTIRISKSPPKNLMMCEFQVWVCEGGSYGADCNSSCGHCKDNAPCDPISGNCPDGCAPGYTGDRCDTECQAGTYGADCNSRCGHCKDNTTCDHISGKCPGGCDTGYTGFSCHTECGAGTYGENCDKSCGHCTGGHTCNHVTGECKSCDAGWRGNLCIAVCEDGTYGTHCLQHCGQCKHNVTCHHINGTCSEGCASGWTANKCNQMCEGGTYGADCNSSCGHCKDNTTCDHISGNCPAGCDIGYTGDRCDTECQAGTYGADCNSRCGHCKDNTTCDHISGKCPGGCVIGYTGDRCDIECSERTYGENCSKSCGHCTGDTCNHVTGECNSCDPGWRGNFCIVECEDGKYGANCQLSCRRCKDDEACDKKTGKCAKGCPPGLLGDLCDQQCPLGSHGDGCNQTCGRCRHQQDCHHENGFCSNGCLEGFQGTKCMELVDTSTSAAGVAVGIIFVIILLAVVIFLIVRRIRYGSEDRYATAAPSAGNDFNRVVLEKVKGDNSSDYINASFITGYKRDKAYIAAQGPRNNTVDDFWRMVWQENVTQIIMLTNALENGKSKCFEYWPAKGEKNVYGQVEVTCAEEDKRAHFIVRTLHVQPVNVRNFRLVEQLHYVDWKDHEIPSTIALTDFCKFAKSRNSASTLSPPLEQYSFVYEVVLEAYSSLNTRREVAYFDMASLMSTTTTTDDKIVDTEFQNLCPYWPTKEEKLVAENYTVTLVDKDVLGVSLQSYSLKWERKHKHGEVHLLSFTDWRDKVPGYCEDLVHLLQLLLGLALDTKSCPVLIQCIDGAAKSGLFCVLCNIITQMTSDLTADIFMKVREMQEVRPEVVTSLEEYRFCYEVAHRFRASQSLYANR
ncbi:hypothetical protein C0Q70_15783 [Pomacea canaliculata]|uniref:Protein-tyrosine-phosphatase n=1 Tax=Pomacea canaliculata TaxID=400727 RepID=A0A2T7NVU5_POMCA|nr:hypothetical protein C0Q70_15783 [Pomacea canaliculata]